jgi:hypothetical protein
MREVNLSEDNYKSNKQGLREHLLVGAVYNTYGGHTVKITGVLSTGKIFGVDIATLKELEFDLRLNCASDPSYNLMQANKELDPRFDSQGGS